MGSRARSLLTLRPDQPLTQTGVLGEPRMHPIRSRTQSGRVDGRHAWIDPLLVAGAWVLGAVGVAGVVRAIARRR